MRTEIKNGEVILYGNNADFKVDTKRYYYTKSKNQNHFVKSEVQTPMGLSASEKEDALIALDRVYGERLSEQDNKNDEVNQDMEENNGLEK